MHKTLSAYFISEIRDTVCFIHYKNSLLLLDYTVPQRNFLSRELLIVHFSHVVPPGLRLKDIP